MPCLKIDTNLPKNAIPSDFFTKATDLMEKELGKPAKYVLIQVNPDLPMSFSSSTEPCADVTVKCIGVVGPEKNRQLAPILCKFIEDNLGIKQDRFYIQFIDVERSSCAWNGQTFG